MGTTVETDKGLVQGYDGEGVLVFKGIPYAAAPVGANRWQPPQPHEGWSGLLEVHEFGAEAPQNDSALDSLMGESSQETSRDEDCLFLNIWTPGTDTATRPVMVWIHGGGFTIGAGSQPIYDGQYLARQGDVVIVTINYRMGALGFMNLKELTGGKIPATGNEGLLDQIAALKWVQDNIANFGGDAGNVTIFGESAGGMSVGALLAMPKARGLFHKAIPQSGACHTALTREQGMEIAGAVLELLEVDPADRDTLMNLPIEALLEAQVNLAPIAAAKGLPSMSFQPVIDGEDLPKRPIDLVREGSAKDIAILAGSTLEEWKLFSALNPKIASMTDEALLEEATKLFGDNAEVAIDTYREHLSANGKGSTPGDIATAMTTDRVFRLPAISLLEAQSQYDARTYSYLFDWESPLLAGMLGACHAVELGYVFGTYDKEGADKFFGSGEDADRLSARTMAAWLSFAHSGRPACGDLPDWPVYDNKARSTMVLSKAPHVEKAPAEKLREIWTLKGASIGNL